MAFRMFLASATNSNEGVFSIFITVSCENLRRWPFQASEVRQRESQRSLASVGMRSTPHDQVSPVYVPLRNRSRCASYLERRGVISHCLHSWRTPVWLHEVHAQVRRIPAE